MTQPTATGAYQQQSTAARTQLAAVIAALWASLPDYRNESMRLFTAQAVPLVEAAMGHMQFMTAAYLAALAGEAGGSSIPVAAKAVTVASVRNGVDPGDVYGRPFHLVWRMLAEQKPLDSAKISLAVLAGETRAVQTAVTDLQLAKTHTAQQVIAADPRAVGYRRVLEGPHSCALCVVASTRRYHKSELLPIHPGCVLGGTLVSVPAGNRSGAGELGPIKAATRRWYEGEAVTLGVASGDLLTVTPNHPVLTPRGWIPAGLLREGDEVVRSAVGDRVVGRVPHEHEMPALIEDRFRAASVKSLVAVPLAPEDFHGDGAYGHVGVVPADRFLRNWGKAARREVARQMDLTRRAQLAVALASVGDLSSLGFGMDATARSDMCGSGLGGTVLGRHAHGAPRSRRGSVSDFVTGRPDGADQRGPADSIFAAQVQDGLTVEIAGDRTLRDESSGPRFDAPTPQFAGEGRRLYADRGRSLCDRLAGQVKIDSLVFVRRINLAAHVYNLHTVEGWYAADAFIVSNCDCSVEPLRVGEAHGPVLDEAQLAAAHAAVAERFGADSTAAREIHGALNGNGDPLLYRDVLITHEHGELGPVIGVRGQAFTGPSAIAH